MEKTQDHRTRVGAVRREKMKARLLESALRLIVQDGLQAFSIDRLIVHAGVSRGTFYKYYEAPDALIRELALGISNELIQHAEPLVQRLQDPAVRIATGLRALMHTCLANPVLGHFLVRLGWSDLSQQHLLFNYVQRDIVEGQRQGRFGAMPVELALCLVGVSGIAGIQVMLLSQPTPDIAQQTAAAVLRALGMGHEEAWQIANAPLHLPDLPVTGLIYRTMSLSDQSDPEHQVD